MLATDAITVTYGGFAALEEVTITIPRRSVTVLVGPNGCGKSTLLRTLARVIEPRAGTVLLDGTPLAELRQRALARRLGLLPQALQVPEGLLVEDLVARGRYPHQGWLRQWSRDDERAVAAALEATGTAELAKRPLETLSGGQRQRAWIAMALAQEPEVLLLDEPTTFLDLAHQLEVLELLRALAHRDGRTVVLVLHDINQAARYADQLIALRAGCVVACGAPREVITEKRIETVFGISARVVADPVSGTPLCVPLAPLRSATPAPGAAE